MKAQHTPTPWTFENITEKSMNREKFYIYGPDSPILAELTSDNDSIDFEEGEQEANAAHIVHCVNIFEQLVAALEDALDSFADISSFVPDSEFTPGNPGNVNEIRGKLERALAAAKKGAE